jgi:hypothetical protein
LQRWGYEKGEGIPKKGGGRGRKRGNALMPYSSFETMLTFFWASARLTIACGSREKKARGHSTLDRVFPARPSTSSALDPKNREGERSRDVPRRPQTSSSRPYCPIHPQHLHTPPESSQRSPRQAPDTSLRLADHRPLPLHPRAPVRTSARLELWWWWWWQEIWTGWEKRMGER